MSSPKNITQSTPIAGRGYYRFPTIHEDTIVFTAEGDLWRVDVTGGMAQRLTTHHGTESHAAISPDGTLLAFSAQYEGATEVYTMPLTGGTPTRHTYEDESALVVGWTPNGEILYSTEYFSTLPNTQLVTIDPISHEQTLIPLAQASDGSFKSTSRSKGKVLFFTRLPFQGSQAKRYKGGSVENIWRFDLSGKEDSPEAFPLTQDYPGTSKNPMWWNRRVYFASDRDGTMNLWSMTERGTSLKQHTFHQGWDIHSPALHKGKIVYQLGPDLRLFDIQTGQDQEIPITLASDFDQTREKWLSNPLGYLSSAHLSPTGDRVALTARGRLFVAPVKEGRIVTVTQEAGVRYRDGQFTKDGNSLLALSDETGEFEFWLRPIRGKEEATQLTDDGTIFRYGAVQSPDGQWIAHSDKNNHLWITHLEDKRSILIAGSDKGENKDENDDDGNEFGYWHYVWSPDSEWLAYVAGYRGVSHRIRLYSLADDVTLDATSDRFDCHTPTWSIDGKWLYFLSERHFESVVSGPWGPRQPEPYFEKETKIYMLSLPGRQRSPFQPEDETVISGQAPAESEKTPSETTPDEQEPTDPLQEMPKGLTNPEGEEPKEDPADESDGATEAASNGTQPQSATENQSNSKPEKQRIQIEPDGLVQRLMEVPQPVGNYYSLTTNGKFLFWLNQGATDSEGRLYALEIKNRDINPVLLMSGVSRYELSLDGKKLLVQQHKTLYVIEAHGEAPKNLADQRVNLSQWSFAIQPREEWRQMLIEAWRLERDYFYDPNLHGVDWHEVLERHLPVVARVTDRDELNDLISQVIGELSALHTSARGGDRRWGRERVGIGSLGALLKRDEKKGGYAIQHIYQNDPDYPERRGPLDRPDLDIESGDVLEAINGIPILSVAHPAVLLKNQAWQQTLLQIRSQSADESREIVVKPINSRQSASLRYSEWEYTNRLYVDNVGQRQLGYVHLRAMGGRNYTEWVRDYYPVFDRSGLIIDMRNNNGGNIDSWILEKLLRRAWFYWKPRQGAPYWNMHYAFRGHMVVLVNEHTASDGEAFSEGFRRLGLGKVIGTRTWGGGIWLSNNTHLVDYGLARTAQTGMYDDAGNWIVEGHGIDPDIVVDNLPHTTFLGEDAQLDAAIAHLQKLIEEEPIEVPPAPPYPDKS